jgi:hypothetical protein
MSWVYNVRAGAVLLASAVTFAASSAEAEVELAESKGWKVTTDGRVNAFASHIWADDRPEGLESLNWVGFNESSSGGQADADGKLRRTRIRGGYVPSTLAFNLSKQSDSGLKFAARAEIGFQITNIDPTAIANPTWMDPRAVYLDIAGPLGSLRAGRDFSLFSRGNLFMNYELGHAYGVGFPCAYEKVFGGACGHVGFGTLWPDFRAQITYSTPKFLDAVQVSVGVFDPRSALSNWVQMKTPRIEGEAVVDYRFAKDWGFKAFVNGMFQTIGIGADVVDPTTFAVVGREDYSQNAFGVGYGLLGYLGAFKLGVSGFNGKGMDAFDLMPFNPIYFGQASIPNEERRFRPVSGLLAEASVSFFDITVMGGFGQTSLDRVPTDIPIDTLDAFPLIRSQRGISAGVFYRVEDVVFGLDYFNAHYGFDPRLSSQPDGAPPRYTQEEQVVNVINAGVTLEW